MDKHIILIVGVLTYGVTVFGLYDKIISKGKWSIDSIEKCPDPEQYPFEINLRKKKFNRTHDALFGSLKLPENVTENGFGVIVESYKKVDGGCKLAHVMTDTSICRFLPKFTGKNFETQLTSSGLKPRCPLPQGIYTIGDSVYNYDELPDEGMRGKFKSFIYMTKKSPQNLMVAKNVACLILHTAFNDDDDD